MPNNEVQQVELVTVVSKRERTAIAIIILTMFIFLIIAIPTIMFTEEQKYAEDHGVGHYVCPNCNSSDTEGFHTFWYNSGGLCNGSKEYNLQHADFTFFSCNYCGNVFKVYRSQWENKSK